MRVELLLPRIEQSVKKRCGTCLHFQKAPLHGQGWCRNREIRSEQERALVSRHDYRCIQMLDDYWEPAADLDEPNDLSVKLMAFAPVKLPGLKKYHIYAASLSLVLFIIAVALFSTNATSTPMVSSASKGPIMAEAKDDFWLREEATSAIPSIIYIMAGSKLELMDSKAGEIIDASLPASSKWYRLRVVSSGDVGWAYSGWVERY